MKLIDSHVHLDDSRLADDYPVILQRASEAGIYAMIVPAVQRQTWPRLRQICLDCPQAWPGYGLHPYYIAQHRLSDLDDLRDWIALEKPVAVGECGLDYQRTDLDKALQIDFYCAQLQIAREFDLPIIIHATHAVDDVTNTYVVVATIRGQSTASMAACNRQRSLLIWATCWVSVVLQPIHEPRGSVA